MFLLNRLKLRAAVGSMHQFLGGVRAIFPDPVDDAIVEAVTILLYERVAADVFSRRFAAAFRARIREIVKFAAPHELEACIGRIEAQIEAFEHVPAAEPHDSMGCSEFTLHVRNVIRAILVEADPSFDSGEIVRMVFPRFELAVRRIKKHLEGIKRQSAYMMR